MIRLALCLLFVLATRAWAYEEIILNALDAVPQTTDNSDGRHIARNDTAHSYRAIEFGVDSAENCVNWHTTLPPTYTANAEMDAVVSYTQSGASAVAYTGWTFRAVCVADAENYHNPTFSAAGTSFTMGATTETIGRLYISEQTGDGIITESGCAARESIIVRLCNSVSSATRMHILNVTLRFPCSGTGACP